MDGYAAAYVAHNVPLLVVSGLDAQIQDKDKLKLPDGAIRIASEIPPVESEDAQVLLRHFRDSDAGDLAWNAREYSGRNKFRVKTVGRVVSGD
jgi:trafficking protein particle complex subunit 11